MQKLSLIQASKRTTTGEEMHWAQCDELLRWHQRTRLDAIALHDDKDERKMKVRDQSALSRRGVMLT